MNLIEQSVKQIRKENLKNYYDTEQAEFSYLKRMVLLIKNYQISYYSN